MNVPRDKRGQGSANGAVVLIALMTLLILLYIIFIPVENREDLLDINGSRSSRGSGSEFEQPDEGRVVEQILREFPGTVSVVHGVEDEKLIPNVFLVESTQATELARFNPFIVQTTSFDEKVWEETFRVDDLSDLNNVFLSFNARSGEGVLTILLNDKVIFESEVKVGTEEPVNIHPNDLRRDNTLVFKVDKPGFFGEHQYNIDRVRIVGDITDRDRQSSENLFLLSDEEANNIDEATLKFIPYCEGVTEVGRLEVYMNNNRISSAIPICEDPVRMAIPPHILRRGDNEVEFKTSQGSYSIEQIVVDLEFEEERIKPYFFFLENDDIDDINETGRDLQIKIRFVDDGDVKDLLLDVNGRKQTIDTEDNPFIKFVNATDLIEGNNFVRLIPVREDVDIAELRVDIVT